MFESWKVISKVLGIIDESKYEFNIVMNAKKFL